jgi:hypothetical protein
MQAFQSESSMITLNFGKSMYFYRPGTPSDEAAKYGTDMVITIPTDGSLGNKLNGAYLDIKNLDPRLHILTPKMSKEGYIAITLPEHDVEDGLDLEREVISILWIQERHEWIAVRHDIWRESSSSDDETYDGPYEIDEYLERMLVKAYGIDWQAPKLVAIKNLSPLDLVCEIILHAALNSIAKLRLNERVITDLPAEVIQLIKLEIFDLSNNMLESLPTEFGNLQNLKRLDLSNNKIAELPTSIRSLSRLEYLNISGNKIQNLPSWIGEFGNLEELIT